MTRFEDNMETWKKVAIVGGLALGGYLLYRWTRKEKKKPPLAERKTRWEVTAPDKTKRFMDLTPAEAEEMRRRGFKVTPTLLETPAKAGT